MCWTVVGGEGGWAHLTHLNKQFSLLFLHKTIELDTQKCDNITLFNRLWYKKKLYYILNWVHLLFSEYSNNKNVLSELFATMSVLVVRDEFCKAVMDMGGLDFILQAFQNNMAEKVKIINPFYNLIKIICYDIYICYQSSKWKLESTGLNQFTGLNQSTGLNRILEFILYIYI